MYAIGMGVHQSYKQAHKWYVKSANQGNDSAQVAIAILYSRGFGVEKNYKKAFDLLSQYSNSDSTAQFYLGQMYHHGLGVNSDLSKAKEWYKKSCDFGLQIACKAYLRITE